MVRKRKPARPDWDGLWVVAAEQAGLFTTGQAAEQGFSSPLLVHHLRSGAIERARRGVYRITRLPRQEHEDLISIWLALQQEAVFSHESALALHELSDALPDRPTITLPVTWQSRRVRYPKHAVVHFAELAGSSRSWVGNVPVTSVARTIEDCVASGVSPDLVEQAIREARRRGLVDATIERDAKRRLDRSLRTGGRK